jgi:hypothetical protein
VYIWIPWLFGTINCLQDWKSKNDILVILLWDKGIGHWNCYVGNWRNLFLQLQTKSKVEKFKLADCLSKRTISIDARMVELYSPKGLSDLDNGGWVRGRGRPSTQLPSASCLQDLFNYVPHLWGHPIAVYSTEAEFLDVVGTKVLGVFLLAFHSHLYSTNGFYSPPSPPNKSGLKLVGKANIVYENLKSERSQDYALEIRKLYVHEFGFRTVVSYSYCTSV